MAEAGQRSDLHALVDELSALHRGRGVRRSPLLPSVGSRLLRVLGATAGSDEATLRLTLVAALVRASEDLDADLRTAFRHAAGVVGSHRLLQDRLDAAGQELDRDARTVRRRLSQANIAVAERLLSEHVRRTQHPNAPSGWTVTTMCSDLDLRGDRPSITADKVILAGRRLTELTESLYLPLADPDLSEPNLDIEVLGGGRLLALEQVEERNWRYRLELDRPIATGQSHRYQVRVTVSSAVHLPPYNAVAPLRSCEEFECRVGFAPGRLPSRIQRVDGLPTSVFNDPVGTRHLLPVGATVVATFRDLTPGLAYGLRWAF